MRNSASRGRRKHQAQDGRTPKRQPFSSLVPTTNASHPGMDVVHYEDGIRRRIGSKAAGVLAVLLAAAILGRSLGVAGAPAGALAALVDLLEFVLQPSQPSPQLGDLRLEFGVF